MKKCKDSFRLTVQKCLSRDDVLTTARQRMFSRRARVYMLAYKALDVISKSNVEGASNDEGNNADQVKVEVKQEFPLSNNLNSQYNYSLIERVVKSFKTHRCMEDIDTSYIREIVQQMVNIEIEVSEG